MKYLCVHSVYKDLFELDLKDYILTFDDGLYSQYFYWDLISKIGKHQMLFISTGSVRLTLNRRSMFDGDHRNFNDCFKSMKNWKSNNDLEDYMTLGELKYLIRRYNVEVGGHGHNHIDLKIYKDLNKKVEVIKKDIFEMFNWFKENLSIKPIRFAFPFNGDDLILRLLLRQEGIRYFYGQERVEFELLCHEE